MEAPYPRPAARRGESAAAGGPGGSRDRRRARSITFCDAARCPCPCDEDERRRRQEASALLAELGSPLRIEGRDVRARRANALVVRLPPIFEGRVLDCDREHGRLDVAQPGRVEQLRQLTLARA